MTLQGHVTKVAQCVIIKRIDAPENVDLTDIPFERQRTLIASI